MGWCLYRNWGEGGGGGCFGWGERCFEWDAALESHMFEDHHDQSKRVQID